MLRPHPSLSCLIGPRQAFEQCLLTPAALSSRRKRWPRHPDRGQGRARACAVRAIGALAQSLRSAVDRSGWNDWKSKRLDRDAVCSDAGHSGGLLRCEPHCRTCRWRPAHISPGFVRSGSISVSGRDARRGNAARRLRVGQGPHRGPAGYPREWAEIRDGRIERFRTFVTGEIFSTLANHSFLSKVATAEADHSSAAFAEGVALARAEAGKPAVS